MNQPLVLPRAEFIEALGDPAAAGSVGSRLAPILEAHTAIAVERRSEQRRTMLWIGATLTVVATGDDPVTVTHIRAANTPLAVLDSIGLRPQGRARCASWWQIRIAANTEHRCIEGYDRSPGPTWLVVDEPTTTSVRRATINDVVATICDALARDRDAFAL